MFDILNNSNKAPESLNDILGTFTTVKSKLSSFLEDGEEHAKNLEQELNTVVADNNKAKSVLSNIDQFLGRSNEQENTTEQEE